jgi:hypothetical protein
MYKALFGKVPGGQTAQCEVFLRRRLKDGPGVMSRRERDKAAAAARAISESDDSSESESESESMDVTGDESES